MRVLAAGLILLSGCGVTRPARWAETLSSRVTCGMSQSQVAEEARRPVSPLNHSWGTHVIGDGATEVWLVFENDELRSIQVAWMYALKRMKAEPKIDLCG